MGGISRPSRAALHWANSQGLPKIPRPIMAMSAPVYLRMRGASSGLNTSPLAITGMCTAFFTSRIQSQLAVPAYICTLVRPWTATAAAPASSMARANSTQLMEPLSQPRRNFTVTGQPAPRTTASITFTARSGLRIRPEPSPELATLGTGQPMLMSMKSAPDTWWAMAAASCMHTGSLPKIWAAAGCSPSPSFKRGMDFLSWKHRALELTISVQVSPAPCSRQMVRKATSVTPAMGARARGVLISIPPMDTISIQSGGAARWPSLRRLYPFSGLSRSIVSHPHSR